MPRGLVSRMDPRKVSPEQRPPREWAGKVGMFCMWLPWRGSIEEKEYRRFIDDFRHRGLPLWRAGVQEFTM